MINHHTTLTGRRYDITELDSVEKHFLEEIFALYHQRPHWSDFKGNWLQRARQTLWGEKVPVGHPVYRICQDLAARLGIAEGRVSPPDYRDRIADLIEERYRSRYAFCKQHNIDQGHLSRVLAGKKHLAPETFFRILDILGVEIELVGREEVFLRPLQHLKATTPAERLDSVERQIAALSNLAAKAENYPQSERLALVAKKAQRSLFAEDDPYLEVREKVASGVEFGEAISEILAQLLTDKRRIGLKLQREAEEQTEELHNKKVS